MVFIHGQWNDYGFHCHEYDVGGEMEGNETKDNGLVVVGGLNDVLVIWKGWGRVNTLMNDHQNDFHPC